ncbi:hypothetical protein QCM77_10955 [Bradyrhizobium sp. SSUT18]|uniref:hypothetical protein n=1 Tax=Bradyrhizobium sp. SSUT18 TaxID=3040602 RepID=UPI002448F484|nr:hypothetical protein [Bradyrhizobium sp. SSUT18]MDH2400452.1 hypothetical protein [Bradyrhizobium sp. SSUT18]
MSYDESDQQAGRLRTENSDCVGPITIGVALEMVRTHLASHAPDEAVQGVFFEAMSSGQVYHRQSRKERFHRDPLFWQTAELRRGDDDHVRVVHRFPGTYVGNFALSEELTRLGVSISGDGLAFWLRRHFATSIEYLLQEPENRSTIDRAIAGVQSESVPTDHVERGKRELSEIDTAAGRPIKTDDETRRQQLVLMMAARLWETNEKVIVKQADGMRSLGNGKDAVVALARHFNKSLDIKRRIRGNVHHWRDSFAITLGASKQGPRTQADISRMSKIAKEKCCELSDWRDGEIYLEEILRELVAA